MGNRLAFWTAGFAMLMVRAAIAAEHPNEMPDPARSAAAVPSAKYESTFSGYRPFGEVQSKPWIEANKDVADGPGMGHDMGAMGMPGKPVAGTGKPPQAMAAMRDNKAMTGAHGHSAAMPKARADSRGHDMSAMREAGGSKTPGKDARLAGINGTGVVQAIDRNNGKIRLTHDPIAALAWPRMTMFFRLKDAALAEQLKEGDRIGFSLEKTPSGFVISALQKVSVRSDMKDVNQGTR